MSACLSISFAVILVWWGSVVTKPILAVMMGRMVESIFGIFKSLMASNNPDAIVNAGSAAVLPKTIANSSPP